MPIVFADFVVFCCAPGGKDVTINKEDRKATIKDPVKHRQQAEAFSSHKGVKSSAEHQQKRRVVAQLRPAFSLLLCDPPHGRKGKVGALDTRE